MNMKLNFIPLVSGMVACATVLTAQPITRNIITTNANPSFVAGVAAGGGTVTETNTTTRRVAIHINTNVVNALAAAEAAKTTNGLGSAAWEAVEDFDASGAAQNATNGLNEALAPQIASKLATNGSGAGLTALPAGQLTGTLDDARLSRYVARQDSSPIFRGLSFSHRPAKSYLVLTMDDNQSEANYNAWSNAIVPNGWPVTVFVNASNLVTIYPERLACISNLHALGWEVGSHSYSHPFLTNLTWGQVSNEFYLDQTTLRGLGFEADNHAYPYGSFNDEIKQLSRSFFRSARKVSDWTGYNSPPFDFQELFVMDSAQLTNAAWHTNILDAINANPGQLYILLVHYFIEEYAAGLTNIFSYAATLSNVVPATMNQAMDGLGPLVDTDAVSLQGAGSNTFLLLDGALHADRATVTNHLDLKGDTVSTGHLLMVTNRDSPSGVGARLVASRGASGATANDTYSAIKLEDDASVGISILTPSNFIGALVFGDPGDNDVGMIRYFHATDTLTWKVAGADRMTLNSNGDLTLLTGTLSASNLASGTNTATVGFTSARFNASAASVNSIVGYKGSSGATANPVYQLLLEDNASTGMQMLSPSNSIQSIVFGDPENNDAGRIIYNHAGTPPSLLFTVEGSDNRLVITATNIVFGVPIHGNATSMTNIPPSGVTLAGIGLLGRDTIGSGPGALITLDPSLTLTNNVLAVVGEGGTITNNLDIMDDGIGGMVGVETNSQLRIVYLRTNVIAPYITNAATTVSTADIAALKVADNVWTGSNYFGADTEINGNFKVQGIEGSGTIETTDSIIAGAGLNGEGSGVSNVTAWSVVAAVSDAWTAAATNAAYNATNVLGTAAWVATSAFDAAGTAQNATNKLDTDLRAALAQTNVSTAEVLAIVRSNANVFTAQQTLSNGIVIAGSAEVFGTFTADLFSGPGYELTSLQATQLDGTIPDARLSANVLLRTNVAGVSGFIMLGYNEGGETGLAFVGEAGSTNLHVPYDENGGIRSPSFTGAHVGDGSGLTGIVATTTNVPVDIDHDIIVEGNLTVGTNIAVGHLVLQNGEYRATVVNQANVIVTDVTIQSTNAVGFIGEASNLTSLNASELESGTVPLASIPTIPWTKLDDSELNQTIVLTNGFAGWVPWKTNGSTVYLIPVLTNDASILYP